MQLKKNQKMVEYIKIHTSLFFAEHNFTMLPVSTVFY